MSAELKDDDSSGSDCFIVEVIKPVKRPLVQKTLVIKSSTGDVSLHSNRNETNKKKDKVRKASTDSDEAKSRKKRASLNNSISSKETLSKTDSNTKNVPLDSHKDVSSEGLISNSSIEFSPKNTIAPKIGTPIKSYSEKLINPDEIKLSPGISRKGSRFHIIGGTSKAVKKNFRKPLTKMLDEVDEGIDPIVMEEFNTELSLVDTQTGTVRGNSELLSTIVKDMIRDVTTKHSALFLESERKILDRIFKIKESACKLLVRMLGRKYSWHRVCDITYKDISDNLENEFEILHEENYVDTNIEDEDLKIQMNLLKKPEIQSLCKVFNMSFKFIENKKEDLINSLIRECQRQKSALDMFKGKSSTTRLDRLKSQVRKDLGTCIQLNNRTCQVFQKVLLLASFPHYYDEEDHRFTNELHTRSQVYKKQIKFPTYKVSSVAVFECLADFEEYAKAISLQGSFEVAISNKNYEEFATVFLEAKERFEKLLQNVEFQERFLNLKPFLRRFSAGTVYARILAKYCTTFKKKVDNSEIQTTAELLLRQNLFLTRKKGDWYETLSIAFKNEKQTDAAAETIVKGLRDPGIGEVQKLTLQLRGRLLLKAKTHAVSEASLRNELSELCMSSVSEPTHVEIKGKAMEENPSGFRCIYIEESKNGRRYVSVEERAISYYKLNGFTKGYHTEGLIIQSLYFLLFYDVIYGLSPEGVFLSPYQEAPLDFNSSSFYESRKEEIDILLSDMSGWDDVEVEAKIRDSFNRNYGITCLIKWSDELTADLFCEVAKCITVPILVLIFQRFVRNFRQVRAGFPDLTLWNPETNRCKFVEVKSPTDKLSPGQRVWLDFLKSIGLDCEVCNVKNVAGKSYE